MGCDGAGRRALWPAAKFETARARNLRSSRNTALAVGDPQPFLAKKARRGRVSRRTRKPAVGIRGLSNPERVHPTARAAFEAPRLPEPRNFRNPATSKVRNSGASVTRELAKNNSGSWRIPSAAAQIGALGGRSRRKRITARPDSGKLLVSSAPAANRRKCRDRFSNSRKPMNSESRKL